MQVFQNQNLKWKAFWHRKRGNISRPFIFALRRTFMYFCVIGHHFYWMVVWSSCFCFQLWFGKGNAGTVCFFHKLSKQIICSHACWFLSRIVFTWFLYSTIRKCIAKQLSLSTIFRYRDVQKGFGLSELTEKIFAALSFSVYSNRKHFIGSSGCALKNGGALEFFQISVFT